MVVPSVFELNSIKDQLALLASLTSHIDFNSKEFEDDALSENFEKMLTKMDYQSKNLKEKYENLKKLLEN